MARSANNQLLDKDGMKQWILRRLGAPVWEIQLCEEHVEDAIEQAIRWFAAKKGMKGHFVVEVIPQQACYDLDDCIDTVLDVSFSEAKLDLSLIFSPFTLLEEKIPYDVFASGASGGLYSSYVQSLQYIKTAKRILSAELEWTQFNNQIFVAPVPVHARSMILWAKTNFTQLTDLKERDHDLVKRYALAKAMQDLAFIRGNYTDYPGAQGTTSFNWDRMLSWSETEIEKLEEEIMLSGFPMGFQSG